MVSSWSSIVHYGQVPNSIPQSSQFVKQGILYLPPSRDLTVPEIKDPGESHSKDIWLILCKPVFSQIILLWDPFSHATFTHIPEVFSFPLNCISTSELQLPDLFIEQLKIFLLKLMAVNSVLVLTTVSYVRRSLVFCGLNSCF